MGCFFISFSIISICLSFSFKVSIFKPILDESIPIEVLAAYFKASTLATGYFPLDASLTIFLSLSILIDEINLAVGYSFKMALIADVLILTIDSSSGNTLSRLDFSIIFNLDDSVIKNCR